MNTEPNTEFFSLEQQAAIEQAIHDAELNTSGEIRVHIDKFCQGNVLDRAAEVFAELKMHETELRNGVLIYLAYDTRKFAILGDAGINRIVPENFWDDIKIKMQLKFRAGQFAEGLVEAVKMAGKQLIDHFPKGENNPNELANHITFDMGK